MGCGPSKLQGSNGWVDQRHVDAIRREVRHRGRTYRAQRRRARREEINKALGELRPFTRQELIAHWIKTGVPPTDTPTPTDQSTS